MWAGVLVGHTPYKESSPINKVKKAKVTLIIVFLYSSRTYHIVFWWHIHILLDFVRELFVLIELLVWIIYSKFTKLKPKPKQWFMIFSQLCKHTCTATGRGMHKNLYQDLKSMAWNLRVLNWTLKTVANIRTQIKTNAKAKTNLNPKSEI